MVADLFTSALPAYAELDCLSNFSFLTGASHPEELVERAAKLGYTALALTDECSLAGVVRAHVQAAKHPDLQLIIGSRMALDNGNHAPIELVLLAQDKEGYGNLAELITLGRSRAEKGRYLLRPADLVTPAARGLAGCLAILTPPYGQAPAEMTAQAHWLARHFRGRAGWVYRNCSARVTTCIAPLCNRPRKRPACRWWPSARCTCMCARASPCTTR